jgi:hypothetical protein
LIHPLTPRATSPQLERGVHHRQRRGNGGHRSSGDFFASSSSSSSSSASSRGSISGRMLGLSHASSAATAPLAIKAPVDVHLVVALTSTAVRLPRYLHSGMLLAAVGSERRQMKQSPINQFQSLQSSWYFSRTK